LPIRIDTEFQGKEKGACYSPHIGIDNLCNDNPSVLFRLGYMTRLFPICTDIVTPPTFVVVFVIVSLIDRFTTKRTNALRLLNHHPSLSWHILPLQPRVVTGRPLHSPLSRPKVRLTAYEHFVTQIHSLEIHL